MNKMNSDMVDVNNIYQLDGRVPLLTAIPFGIQHILAMFVANITPIIIIAGTAKLPQATITMLLQNAMFVAGVATLVQLYTLGPIGARLPIVMGISFTFVSALCYAVTAYGYGAMIGAVIVGGLIEGSLGLLARYWRRIITPLVASTVVTTIGYSLLSVGVRSFGGGYNKDFGSVENLILGAVTLISCLVFNASVKGYKKQLSVLFGLGVGYILALFMGKVDLGSIMQNGFVALPHFMPFTPEFHPGVIAAVTIIYLVSATETIGDVSAMTMSGLNRDVTEKEIAGAVSCDGFVSSIAALFGCSPITSFSQNVGLIAMTKVVNRFTIMTGAVCMILASIFPPIAGFFASLPDSVLGGCTIMMFGSIMVSGIQMMSKAGFNQRNCTIFALSLAIGIGSTSASEIGIWAAFPKFIQDIFSGNCVAVVFVVAILMDNLLAKDVE